MITNYYISPHPLLQPFVDDYMFCTSHGNVITLASTWPASNETSFIFYLADKPHHFTNEHTTSPLQHEKGCVVGLQPGCNGMVSFKGVYHTFLIQFKANGFHKLFRIPASDIASKIYYLDDVFGKVAKEVNDRLQHTKDIRQMASIADCFLLSFLAKQQAASNLHDGITFISNKLFTYNALLSVEQYAYHANMSVRNFGRRFTEQVGVSPKLYIRLLRFNKALLLKSKHPESNWISIAYECGYYDQMHLIKDCKEFANANPSSFTNKNATGNPDANALPVSDMVEEFITVERSSF